MSIIKKTDISPTVLDGGNEIILANWPNDNHIICNINTNIPIKIPSHLYVLVSRSVLCNCSIEAENHFLLELLAAYQDVNSKLVMHFTVNTAFINYLDQFSNETSNEYLPSNNFQNRQSHYCRTEEERRERLEPLN